MNDETDAAIVSVNTHLLNDVQNNFCQWHY